MLTYWQILGPGRADDDRRELYDMEPSPEVLKLREWAEEALARHHAWRARYRPDLDIEAGSV